MVVVNWKPFCYADRNGHDRIQMWDFKKFQFDCIQCVSYKIFLKWDIKKLGQSFHLHTLKMMFLDCQTFPIIVASTILVNLSVLTNRGKCEVSFFTFSHVTFLLFVEEWVWRITNKIFGAIIAHNVWQGAFGWSMSRWFCRTVSFGGTHRLQLLWIQCVASTAIAQWQEFSLEVWGKDNESNCQDVC